MKHKTFLFLFVLFIGLAATAQEKLSFIMEDWDQALAEAKAQNKYIVMDAYTEWCGWCKVMDKKTFTHREVIDYYSDKFICLKMDMEKGTGIDLAMKYRVSGFPSILYFNPEGYLVYRTIGYRDTVEFLVDGKEALDPAKQFRHPGDPMVLDPGFPQFYKDSFKKGKERKWPEASVVEEFMSKQQDLFSEVSWSVMSRFSLNAELTDFFMQNKDTYAKMYGSTEVDDKFSDIIVARVQFAIKNKESKEFDAAIDMLHKHGSPEDTASMARSLRMYYFEKTADWDAYSAMALKIVEEPDATNSMKNSYAWAIYENVDDKKVLTAARDWMKSVVEAEPDYAYIDTYAALLYKLGQYKEAEKQALKAIEVGTENKNNVEGTQELLEKIRKAK